MATFGWGTWNAEGATLSYTIGSTKQTETLTATQQSSSTRASDTYNSIVKWYTFTIIGSNTSNNVTLTVSDGSSNAILNSVISSSYVAVNSLYFTLGNAHAEIGFDDMTLRTYSDNEVVPNPTASITGVDGVKRTITLAVGTGSKDGTTLAWSTNSDMSEATAYSAPFEVSTTGTIYYQAISPTSAKSEIQSLTVECVELTLNTPTWTKTGYAAGVSTVTLTDNQSNVLLSPATTIKYQINDGETQTYSAAFGVNDGETLKYWSEATGYVESAKGSVTATAPCTDPDLFSESYYRSSDGGISVNTEDVAGTINETNYYYMYCDAAHISERLVTSSTGLSNWLLRTGGLYAGNTGNYAVKGVNKGDYVTITFAKGDGNPSSSDGTLDEWNSTTTTRVFKVTATMGNFRFSFPRYGYIKSIKIQRALATPGATVGSTGYATFAADVDLDLSTLTSGFKAYFASAASNGKVTMTKATNEKIAAGEGLFIEGSGAFTITETRDDTDDVDNYLVAGNGVTDGIVKETGFDKYVLAADGESVSFFLINATPATVATNKAYLKVPSSGGSARLAIVFDNDPTGISTIENNSKDMNGYYNLNGQRVAQPAKGLYIVNGKKVIMK